MAPTDASTVERTRDAAIQARLAGENPIDYLKRRGYVQDIANESELRALFERETVTGYVGLAIPREGGDYNYGYAHFSVNVQGKFMELHDFAYETELNTPITVVPEPATVHLLLGATGLLAARTRRSRQA